MARLKVFIGLANGISPGVKRTWLRWLTYRIRMGFDCVYKQTTAAGAMLQTPSAEDSELMSS